MAKNRREKDDSPKDVKPKDAKPKDVKPKDVQPKDIKPKDVKPKEEEASRSPTTAAKPSVKPPPDKMSADMKNFLASLDEAAEGTPEDKPKESSAPEETKEEKPIKSEEKKEQKVQVKNIRILRGKRRHSPKEDDDTLCSTSKELVKLKERNIRLLEEHSRDNSDPDLLFFKSLIPYMKVFPKLKKLRIRSEIQDLVTEEYEPTQQPKVARHDTTNGAGNLTIVETEILSSESDNDND